MRIISDTRIFNRLSEELDLASWRHHWSRDGHRFHVLSSLIEVWKDIASLLNQLLYCFELFRVIFWKICFTTFFSEQPFDDPRLI